jgi:hypothetical protein
MKEENLSQQESLSIIQQMISTAKQQQKDDGKGWIIWGWMLFAASVLTVLNINFKWSHDYFLFWNSFGIITIIWFVWETISYFFIKKKVKVKTYTGDLLARLNAGFFIGLMFIIFSINVGSYFIRQHYGEFYGVFVNIGFALLINLYSFWILIYGTALNFKPSIIGAYFSWAFGFAALFANNFEIVMLLHAAAVLVGYIIPGHIANREFKKLHSKEKVQ